MAVRPDIVTSSTVPRASDRATSSALGSLLMVCVVIVVAAALAVGVLAMSDLTEVARQAENVLQCGRARCP